jgi:hypothetical protein
MSSSAMLTHCYEHSHFMWKLYPYLITFLESNWPWNTETRHEMYIMVRSFAKIYKFLMKLSSPWYEFNSIRKRYRMVLTLTPWSSVLLQKLIVTQLVKKFPAFYGTESSAPCSGVFCIRGTVKMLACKTKRTFIWTQVRRSKIDIGLEVTEQVKCKCKIVPVLN